MSSVRAPSITSHLYGMWSYGYEIRSLTAEGTWEFLIRGHSLHKSLRRWSTADQRTMDGLYLFIPLLTPKASSLSRQVGSLPVPTTCPTWTWSLLRKENPTKKHKDKGESKRTVRFLGWSRDGRRRRYMSPTMDFDSSPSLPTAPPVVHGGQCWFWSGLGFWCENSSCELLLIR